MARMRRIVVSRAAEFSCAGCSQCKGQTGRKHVSASLPDSVLVRGCVCLEERMTLLTGTKALSVGQL